LESVELTGCYSLQYLDLSSNVNKKLKSLNFKPIQSSLKKVFLPKNFPINQKDFPLLEYMILGKIETDVLAQRNTEKIQKILSNPDNYSLDDLEKIEKEDLYGVPNELRQKLVNLIIEKYNRKVREKYGDEGYNSNEEDLPDQEELEEEDIPPLEDDEENEEQEEIPSFTPPIEDSSYLPTPETTPEPEFDYKQLYLDLLEKIKQGKITIDKKDEITNSQLSEEQKQELYRVVDKNQAVTIKAKQPTTNYLPLFAITSMSILLLTLIFKRRKKK
jgi:hypothetical protein